MPYDCFISYASADLHYAEELQRQLDTEGFTVWFDKIRLHPGYDWHREIKEGCENSRVFLPVLTRAGGNPTGPGVRPTGPRQ